MQMLTRSDQDKNPVSVRPEYYLPMPIFFLGRDCDHDVRDSGVIYSHLLYCPSTLSLVQLTLHLLKLLVQLIIYATRITDIQHTTYNSYTGWILENCQ